MLGHPSLAAGHRRGDAQRVALLAEQSVAAVPGTVGPDLIGLGEVRNVLLVVTGPGDVLAGLVVGVAQGVADGVDGRHPLAALADQLEGFTAHSGHDAHVGYHVGRVGQLDAELGDRSAERAHREGNDVHRAAAHGAVELLLEDRLHLGRVVPVIGRAGVLFLLRADEGAGLDARHVRRKRAGEEGVGALLGVEAGEHPGVNHLGSKAIPLLLGTVGPVDGIRLGQIGRLGHECDEILGSLCWCPGPDLVNGVGLVRHRCSFLSAMCCLGCEASARSAHILPKEPILSRAFRPGRAAFHVARNERNGTDPRPSLRGAAHPRSAREGRCVLPHGLPEEQAV